MAMMRQETVNGDTTTFTMDLNMGLTQALSDGTNTYIYGNGRIAQVNTGTEYFLSDALGSVRQLTDSQGDITLVKSYDPYGTVSQSFGTGASPFAYTGEQQDASGLTYLRARYYASGDGRFITQDTWSGDANMPMSYNKWQYVYSNPVNLIDPTGKFPTWCQMMPNKAFYEGCVDLWYGIEPLNRFELGKEVEGTQGCYIGPRNYRAPGYIEGTGVTIALPWIVNWMFAAESVYDFARMEHNYFVNGAFNTLGIPGVGESDFIWGLNVTGYFGNISGLRTDTGINIDYPGPFIVGYIGVSGSPITGVDTMGPSVGIGKIGFASASDPMIRGHSTYVSFGFGVDILPVLDIGFGVISTLPRYSVPESYKNRGVEMYLDILLGKHNVWVSDIFPRSLNATDGVRFIEAGKALRYWAAYEEIPHDK